MIEQNELRKGNLVLFSEDATLFEVMSVDELGLGVKNQNEETWIEHSQFEGVKIDQSLLETLGLIPDDNRRLFQPNNEIKKKCEGDIGFKCPSFFYNNRLERWMDCQTRVCVDFAHQLQNLVFVLTGEELKPISKI